MESARRAKEYKQKEKLAKLEEEKHKRRPRSEEDLHRETGQVKKEEELFVY